ncbi:MULTISPECIES: hypothetical protein [unclassified Mesorhizobium]|uniref:hypothetical protein n=1 Tax=unclassified Mesorhizobium TaxID=325217 RepID=UPI001672D814|nr:MULTISPECIES: hypothetical protein [unclassified Mesorhizobium]
MQTLPTVPRHRSCLSALFAGLKRQGREHQPDAAGDQYRSRKSLPVAFECRRRAIPIVTHTRHPLPKRRRFHSLLKGKKATPPVFVREEGLRKAGIEQARETIRRDRRDADFTRVISRTSRAEARRRLGVRTMDSIVLPR